MKRRRARSSRWALVALVVIPALDLGAACACAPSRVAAASATEPRASLGPLSVPRDKLCVSTGHVEPTGSGLRVDAPGMRGVVAGDASATAELDLVYLGPSSKSVPLASGEARRQIGLKLRAKDTCNVVYVMWHVEPTTGVHVSLKHNPGKETHAQCGAGGYVNLRSTRAFAPAPPVLPGARHVLRATIEGRTLRVLADGATVWEGSLPDEAFSFDGPAGVRSDNGRFDFDLRVPGGARPRSSCGGAGFLGY